MTEKDSINPTQPMWTQVASAAITLGIILYLLGVFSPAPPQAGVVIERYDGEVWQKEDFDSARPEYTNSSNTQAESYFEGQSYPRLSVTVYGHITLTGPEEEEERWWMEGDMGCHMNFQTLQQPHLEVTSGHTTGNWVIRWRLVKDCKVIIVHNRARNATKTYRIRVHRE